MKKIAIITFDYEVFLGRATGTIEKSVINPTKSILKILIENNAKAIFFVDTTWLLFIKENFYADFQLVSKQLKEIIQAGSSVELHLHPHWLQAYKKNDVIVFSSFENYKLHSLSQEDILKMFRNSIELLESITCQKVRCFRAGGFCIEPFAQIKSAFEAFGIIYDFSVVPGMFLAGGNVYDFDFTCVPDKPFYHFQDTVNKNEPDGLFVEIPLSTYKNSPIYRLTNKLILKLKNDKIFGDGIGIQEKSFFSKSSIIRRLKFSQSFLTIDNTNLLFFKYLLKMHFRNTYFLVIISHPKTVSKQALDNLSYITKNYNTLSSINLDEITV